MRIKTLKAAAVAFLVSMLFSTGSISARGVGARGGARPSSRPSVSRPAAPAKAPVAKPKPAVPAKAPTAKPAESTQSPVAKPKAASAGDKALNERLAIDGKRQFSSYAQASDAFKKDYGSKYPTSFDKEPAVRPDYVPQTYTVPDSGKNYTVNFDSQRRSYGYSDGGTWHSYDPFMDRLILMNLMSRNNYYVVQNPAPNYVTASQPVAVAQQTEEGFSVWKFVLILGGVVFVGFLVVFVFKIIYGVR